MQLKTMDSYTLYILEGSLRTDCTRDPKKIAMMRQTCGPEGKIYTWRVNLSDVYPHSHMVLNSVTEWPPWTPDFPGYPGHKVRIDE